MAWQKSTLSFEVNPLSLDSWIYISFFFSGREGGGEGRETEDEREAKCFNT